MMTTVPALTPALAEIVLAVGAMLLLMFGAFKGDRTSGAINVAALAFIGFAAAIVAASGSDKLVTFNGAFVLDSYARMLKLLTLTGAAGALLLSFDFNKRENITSFEFPIIVLLSTIGMMMMISAGDLIALYLGIELMSLALYVLAASRRDHIASTEAGLKYFVLGALSSGMLLYGSSLVYGFSGTVNFAGIAKAAAHPGIGLVVGIVFVFAGLCFKVSAVPFHMWTPDVYEGSPTPITAFFAAAPKVAAMAVFVRVALGAFPGAAHQWQQIIVFVAIASMGLGAFAAIGQRNIKRLLAYSSIGHMGFALVGLAAANQDGAQGVIVYMAIYMVMTLGAFACVLAMRTDKGMVESIDDLAGLSRTSPLTAFLLAMLLFSLAGVPPMAGFFAKFYVFLAAIEAKLYALSVIGVLASVVGAFYYLRIIKIMYFDEPTVTFEPMPAALRTVLLISGAFVILYFIYPAPLVSAATAAAKSLF